MSNLLKSKFLVGVLMIAAVFAVVGVANVSEAASCTITMTLRQGSTGAEVMCLQSLVGATADGQFGPMTKAKVMAWQQANGLVADGVVGPMTKAALMASNQSGNGQLPEGCQAGWAFNPATGKPCTTSNDQPGNGDNGLQGGAGDITIDALSTYGDEEVGEGDEDVKVMAFEIEADDESDVEITSVKVEMNEQDSGDDEDLDAYVESVSVWMGSEKVGEDDADAFSESGDHVWTNSISLDGAVVEAGDTEKFYVAITALSNLDSGDIDTDDWQIGISSVRFVDGEGVTSTESLTLDIDDNAVDDTLEEEFDFATFATASDVELKVALNDDDDDINEAHVINIDDSDDTDGVEILSFTLEAEGSDINVTEIPVVFTTTETTGNDPDDLMSSASLWLDGEEIGTESFVTSDADDSSETITFDDLDIDVGEGDTVELMVKVDIQDTGSTLDAGDTIMADLTATEVDAIEAEDETGEDLAAADLTGTANGEASEVRDAGITVKLVGTPTITKSVACDGPCATGTGESATATFVFDVTAFDADAYLTNGVDEDGTYTAGSGMTTSTTLSAAGGTSTGAYTVVGDEEGSTHIHILEDDTVRVTLTVEVAKATDPGFAKVSVAGIEWNDADSTVTPFNYTFNLDNFETSNIYLNQTD